MDPTLWQPNWQSNEAAASIIRDQVGPTYGELRPGKSPETATFPSHPDIVATMAKDGLEHPHPDIAHVLATCAGYAYSDAGTVSMMMTRMGLENSRCREISRSVDAMLIRSTAHVVQSRDGRVVIVAFRGTPPFDAVSWLLDADVYPERVAAAADTKGEKRDFEVHAGFYRNVRITRHEVVNALQLALNGKSILGETTDSSFQHTPCADASKPESAMESLYITGHSLGGAMAALFTSMLLMSDEPIYQSLAAKLRAVYTFGQPMVGLKSFVSSAEERFHDANVPLLRYVYKKDPVPGLPPLETGHFKHFGDEYRLGSDGRWEQGKSSTSLSLGGVADSIVAYGASKIPVLRNVPFHHRLDDHFPHHYVSALIPEGSTDEFGDYYMQQQKH